MRNTLVLLHIRIYMLLSLLYVYTMEEYNRPLAMGWYDVVRVRLESSIYTTSILYHIIA